MRFPGKLTDRGKKLKTRTENTNREAAPITDKIANTLMPHLISKQPQHVIPGYGPGPL